MENYIIEFGCTVTIYIILLVSILNYNFFNSINNLNKLNWNNYFFIGLNFKEWRWQSDAMEMGEWCCWWCWVLAWIFVYIINLNLNYNNCKLDTKWVLLWGDFRNPIVNRIIFNFNQMKFNRLQIHCIGLFELPSLCWIMFSM